MNLNDDTPSAPRLATYINTDNLFWLSNQSIWGGLEGKEAIKRLLLDGFEGVQIGGSPVNFDPTGAMAHCGIDRINAVGEAGKILAAHKDAGDSCISVHVGWGMESDDEVDGIVGDILDEIQHHQFPCFIETHRATITQDMWRTVELTKRFPELRFNCDFSHYYCGLEMVYGDWDAKVAFLQPIFDRCGFMHARIAAPGWIQAVIEGTENEPRFATGGDYLAHFKELWTRAMQGFRANASRGDVLIFAPELLSSEYYYAQLVEGGDGNLVERSDRYHEALLYREIALSCWDA